MICKYPIMVTWQSGAQNVMIPTPHTLLHVGEQNGVLTVWADVPDPEGPPVAWTFVVVWTGQSAPPIASRHIGTVQCHNGLVAHVYRGAHQYRGDP